MVKVISLSNEAYEMLKRMKNGRSFSEVVVGLATNKNKKNLMDFFGIWKDEEAIEDVKKMIKRDRESSKLKEVKL